jgi:hypothetical protein
MADIPMPKTPRSAYDPKRPANTLLLNHVRELEKAVAEAGRSVRRKKPRTEEQVANYMRHLNRALHQQVLLPKSMKRRPLDVPLDLTPSRRKKASRSKSKSRARPKPKSKRRRRS